MMIAYPAIMAAAVLTGVVIARRTQQQLDLTRGQRVGLGIGAFCGAMLAAKLPFVIADWPGLLSGAAWFESGKTIVLGLVGGYFGVEVAKWSLGVRVKTGDSFAVPVAASIAVGRIACFAGGCCFGVETSMPWGVDFGDGVARHPIQLYEASFHAIAAVSLEWLRRAGCFPRQLIKLYIIAYLVFRFGTEFIRPEPILWLGLTGYQLAAGVFVPLFGLLWLNDARPRHQDPSFQPSARVAE
jgi:phosphatidylglycerol:prolipoprotein diacylglycerol transferase